MEKDKNYLETPFAEMLSNLGFSHFKNFNYFDTGTLFWSLTRLFLHYNRIIGPLHQELQIIRPYMESDIENYIIRQRIILNDIAYTLRQLFPKNLRGLGTPKGPTHPANKEMSISELIKFVEKNRKQFTKLNLVFQNNKSWIFEMRDKRDAIIHYKSKVIIFETKPELSFAILDAAGTEKVEKTPEGGQKLIMTKVNEFINGQTLSLWNFINIDLTRWLTVYIKENKMNYKQIGGNMRMACAGIPLFKEINKIN